jgi:hypothetical protein
MSEEKIMKPTSTAGSIQSKISSIFGKITNIEKTVAYLEKETCRSAGAEDGEKTEEDKDTGFLLNTERDLDQIISRIRSLSASLDLIAGSLET